MNERLWYLIGKKLSGEASQNELEQLHYIESSDPYAAFYFREIAVWWKLTEQLGVEEAKRAFEAHLQMIQEEQSLFSSWLQNSGLHSARRKKLKSPCDLLNWLSNKQGLFAL